MTKMDILWMIARSRKKISGSEPGTVAHTKAVIMERRYRKMLACFCKTGGLENWMRFQPVEVREY